MVFTQLHFDCFFSCSIYLKQVCLQKKRSKAYFDYCVRMKIIYSNMFYAKIFHLLSVSASKFPNIIDKISSFKAHFRLYIKQRSNFEKIIKYLSTFYIRFKRTVSNQRNVHRRFLTTTWIEDRSVLTCAKELDEIAKNYDIHSDPRDWSMIVRMKMLQRD